jgi:hypothetical protein
MGMHQRAPWTRSAQYQALTITGTGTILLVLFALLPRPFSGQERADFNKIGEGIVPQATARISVPMKSYDQSADLGEVAAAFQQGLLSQKYEGQGRSYIGFPPDSKWSHGRPPRGFTVVTQIEQYGDDGKPLEGSKRLQLADTNDDATLMGEIKRVFLGAPVGHYRMLLFAVANDGGHPMSQSLPSTFGAWQTYFRKQYRAPMLQDLKKIPLSAGTLECSVFVYEFDRASADGELVLRDTPRLSAEQHLKGSGLAQALKLNLQ